MENKEKEFDLIMLAKAIWNKKGKLIKWGLAGLVVGIVIAISIPRQYTSVIKIAPESKAKPLNGSAGTLANMMGFNTGDGENGISETIYPEIMASSPFLIEFASIPVQYKNENTTLFKYLLEDKKQPWWGYILSIPSKITGLFSDSSDGSVSMDSPSMRNAFIRAMGGSISIVQDKKNNIFTIKTTVQDPIIAKLVADSCIVKLQRYMTDYRTRKMKSNIESYQKMLSEAQQKYYDADLEYAQSADRNQNLITKSSQIKLERLRNERDLSFQIYQQLAMQVDMDKVKLQEETPIATVIEPADVPLIPSAPNKKLIVTALTLLSILAAAGVVVIKEISATK